MRRNYKRKKFHVSGICIFLVLIIFSVAFVLWAMKPGKEFLICSLGSQSDSSRYDDVNYILKTIDESDYLTK